VEIKRIFQPGRFDAYGEMLRIKRPSGPRYAYYGPHETRNIPDILPQPRGVVKDLPMTLYHIQWKFPRRGPSQRFGVMRGPAEFLMKDGYNL